jgi:hypothetical protein
MKTLFLFLFWFTSLLSFAQELEKNCLLVAIFEKKETGKSWMCRDYTYLTENVSDYEEYEVLSKEYRSKYGDLYLSIKFVSANEHCKIYEYQKEISGWDCTKKVLGIVVADSEQKCTEAMNKRYNDNKKDYKTAPSVAFNWSGNGKVPEKAKKFSVNGLETILRVSKDQSKKDFIFAEFINNTKDQVALIAITDEQGKTEYLELQPGKLQKRFDLKTIQIDVKYKNYTEPTLPWGEYGFNVVKDYIKQIAIEHGKVEVKSWDKKAGCFGIRG